MDEQLTDSSPPPFFATGGEPETGVNAPLPISTVKSYNLLICFFFLST